MAKEWVYGQTLFYDCNKILKISKGLSKVVNRRRIDNTMAKRKKRLKD